MQGRKSGFPCSGRLRCRSALRAAGLLAFGAAAAAAVVGCDPATKYYVLAFFFDGVPAPPGVKPVKPLVVKTPQGPELYIDDPRAKEYLASTQPTTRATTRPKDQGPMFTHVPYAKRQCLECHTKSKSFGAPEAAETCGRCHSAYYKLRSDDWVHGPVALGKCGMCHQAHRSKHRGLLPQPMPELCFSCHQAARTLAQTYHAEAKTRPCIDCHDPHSAGNRLLLVDSTTYQRRKSRMQPVVSAHAKWGRDTCTRCHLPGQSNRLTPDVNARCQACHDKLKAEVAASPKAFHAPLVKGQCVSCHTAHRSPRPHLYRPDAEKVCYQCHKPKDIETDAHPPTRRAECTLCHVGHRSPRKHLLRPTIPDSPRRVFSNDVPPASAPEKRP